MFSKSYLLTFVFYFLLSLSTHAQQVLTSTLLKADKLYINKDYANAVNVYLLYLEKFPRDYYAERQTAICYTRLNIPDLAIDHWPIVVESSEATEYDYLEYGKSLLMNDRAPHAKKIFAVLSRSKDPSLAAWAKYYANPSGFYSDSASIKVLEVNGINTEKHEFSPIITQGKMYFMQDEDSEPKAYHAVNKIESDHAMGALIKDSIHLFPTVFIEKLHAMQISGPVCLSPDGKTLYFSKVVSNKEMKIKSQIPFFRYQLYSLNLSTINNYVPEVKKLKFNQNEFDFMHPSISPDGKRLYFVSNMKGSIGGKDIFVCERVNGDWSNPVNAGAEINTSGNELYPNSVSDSTLFFASDRRPGLGGLDIFYSNRLSNASKLFETAQNAGVPINSRFDDFGLCFYKSKHQGYLSSNRKQNKDDDIFYFTGWTK